MPLTLSNNKRIARNTLLLYVRMLLIMAVTLYTSRIYLRVLGETDFGIYNIVGFQTNLKFGEQKRVFRKWF